MAEPFILCLQMRDNNSWVLMSYQRFPYFVVLLSDQVTMARPKSRFLFPGPAKNSGHVQWNHQTGQQKWMEKRWNSLGEAESNLGEKQKWGIRWSKVLPYIWQLYYNRKCEWVLLIENPEITYWGFKIPLEISLAPRWPLTLRLG